MTAVFRRRQPLGSRDKSVDERSYHLTCGCSTAQQRSCTSSGNAYGLRLSSRVTRSRLVVSPSAKNATRRVTAARTSSNSSTRPGRSRSGMLTSPSLRAGSTGAGAGLLVLRARAVRILSGTGSGYSSRREFPNRAVRGPCRRLAPPYSNRQPARSGGWRRTGGGWRWRSRPGRGLRGQYS